MLTFIKVRHKQLEMNIFFDSIHFYLSLRTYIEHSYPSDCELDTNNRIKRDEIVSFKNGFYPMSLYRHIETVFEQLAYHCRTDNPLLITREEFVRGYSRYDDAGDLFDNLCNDAECLNSEIIIDVILPLTRYQIQDLMSCIYMTTSVDLSHNGIGNDPDSGKGDTPILLHSDTSDVSNNSVQHSFEPFKETDKSELYLTQYENTPVYSDFQKMSPISVTTSFNMDKILKYPHNRSYPTLDVTGYTPPVKTEPSLIQTYSAPSPKHTDTTDFVIGGDVHSIDLSNQTLDISNTNSNTNSIVTIHLPQPDTYSLDTSFSSSLHPKHKSKKSIGEWLCKNSLFTCCTR